MNKYISVFFVFIMLVAGQVAVVAAQTTSEHAELTAKEEAPLCAASRARDVFLSGYLPVDGEKPVATAPFLNGVGDKRSIKDWQGTPVLLNIWATWCPPCVKELPALARLRSRFQQQKLGIDVVAVNVDQRLPGDVTKFLRKVDAGGLATFVDSDRSFMKAVRVGSMPLTLLVNAEGYEIAAVLRDAVWDDPDIANFVATCLRSDQTKRQNARAD